MLAIFISALVALGQTIERFIHPRGLSHLWLPAAAGIIGFVGNEIAAQVRLRAGRRLKSPALVADGNHARVDGFVSLGVLASASVVSLGLNLGDPIIGFVITLVILKITWESWHTVSKTDPGEMLDEHQDLYERGRGRGCSAAAAERATVVCEVGGPSLYRRSRYGAGGLIGAAAAHSSPGQASAHCRSKVGARGKCLRAVGP